MISATMTIAGVVTVVLVIISLILVKATPMRSYASYFPGLISFAASLILLLFATLVDRVNIMGAGFGGWGLAFAFAAFVTLMVTVIFDSYRQTTHS